MIIEFSKLPREKWVISPDTLFFTAWSRGGIPRESPDLEVVVDGRYDLEAGHGYMIQQVIGTIYMEANGVWHFRLRPDHKIVDVGLYTKPTVKRTIEEKVAFLNQKTTVST